MIYSKYLNYCSHLYYSCYKPIHFSQVSSRYLQCIIFSDMVYLAYCVIFVLLMLFICSDILHYVIMGTNKKWHYKTKINTINMRSHINQNDVHRKMASEYLKHNVYNKMNNSWNKYIANSSFLKVKIF